MNELPVSPDDNVPAILKMSRSTVQSWNWAYGQTPEFTYIIHNTFSWGTVVSLPASHQLFSLHVLMDVPMLAVSQDSLKARSHTLVHFEYR